MQDHPFIIAFGVIIVLVTLVLTVRRCAFSRSRRRTPSPTTQQPADIYRHLRKMALETTPASIGITPEPGNTEPWGILMEMGRPGGVATLVAFATGDASLYFSTGGGVIGGVTHENVARAARHFVSTAQGYTDRMEIVTTTPLPDPGKVRFYLLTPQGILAAKADEKDLGKRRHELSPLFYAGQEVITELRLISEQQSKPN